MKKLVPFALVISMLALSGCSSTGASQTGSGAGASSAAQKTYTIARVDGEPDWDSVSQLDINDAEWTDSFGMRAYAQLCHDGQAIYVHMRAEEQDIRATYTPDDPLAKCYEDCCLEFFLEPMTSDSRYLNFEFNPNCAVCNEIGTQKTGRIRLLPASDVLNASPSRIEGGWEITYRVPFSYIQTLYPTFNPERGLQMRGNFYKCGNLTENKHYLVWNHVDSETPNLHAPASFGVLILE